ATKTNTRILLSLFCWPLWGQKSSSRRGSPDPIVQTTALGISQAPYTVKISPALTMRACTFDRIDTMCRIRDNGIKLNAVESASASVAVGAMTLTVLYSDGLLP